MFMLVGLRTNWKYAAGYVICDKTNADNLYSLLLQAFRLASSHDLKVRSVIWDGTRTNFKVMKLLGCDIGTSKYQERFVSYVIVRCAQFT